eukprot:gene24042-29178_t
MEERGDLGYVSRRKWEGYGIPLMEERGDLGRVSRSTGGLGLRPFKESGGLGVHFMDERRTWSDVSRGAGVRTRALCSTIVFTFSSVLFAFLTTATTPLVAGANARGDAKAASETI